MSLPAINEEIVKEMVRNGIVLGHKKSKTHPKMKQFIGGNKNEMEILNPASSWESLQKADEFLKKILSGDGLLLLVGTKPAAKDLIKEFGESLGYPFVINRWLGGTLTNFSVIRARILHYEGLKEKNAKGAFAKYTKKEQLSFAKETAKMTGSFEGIVKLKKLPDAVFIVDGEAHMTTIREAKIMKIPVVAIIDTNDDPSLIDYPIFANDHSKKSVEWVLGKIRETVVSLQQKKNTE